MESAPQDSEDGQLPHVIGVEGLVEYDVQPQRSKGSSGTAVNEELKVANMFSLGQICRTTIRPEILRGISLSRALRNAGRLWRVSPLDMPMKRRSRLWEESVECLHLDAFVSQAWKTPGWQKYITLLMHFYWQPAAVAHCLTGLVLFGLDLANVLPTVTVPAGTLIESQSFSYCLWCPIPTLVSLLVLFAGPHLPFHRDKKLFLDAVCIHQTDTALKKEGIYSLAGFLAKSSKLVVLWAPDYLTRMWCVYELALFSAWKSSTDIVWLQVFQHKFLLGFLLTSTLISSMKSLVTMQVGPVAVAAPLVALGFAYVLIVVYRPYVRQLRELESHFGNFDLRKAECREPVDRDYVTESVRHHWNGCEDDFNSYVQRDLKRKVLDKLPEAKVGYWQLFSALSPFIFNSMQGVAAYHRAGYTLDHFLLICVYEFTESFLYIPLLVRVCLRTVEVVAKLPRRQMLDIFVAIMFTVFVGIFLAALVMLVGYPVKHNNTKPEWVFGYLVANILANLALNWRPCKSKVSVTPAS